MACQNFQKPRIHPISQETVNLENKLLVEINPHLSIYHCYT